MRWVHSTLGGLRVQRRACWWGRKWHKHLWRTLFTPFSTAFDDEIAVWPFRPFHFKGCGPARLYWGENSERRQQRGLASKTWTWFFLSLERLGLFRFATSAPGPPTSDPTRVNNSNYYPCAQERLSRIEGTGRDRQCCDCMFALQCAVWGWIGSCIFDIIACFIHVLRLSRA